MRIEERCPDVSVWMFFMDEIRRYGMICSVEISFESLVSEWFMV